MSNDIFKFVADRVSNILSALEIDDSEQDNQKKQNLNNQKQKFYEDDFNGNKRINRIFTAKQKEQCWNKVFIKYFEIIGF